MEPSANGISPPARVGHASALVDSKIFIFGGHDGKTCLNDVHVLVTMNWAEVGQFELPWTLAALTTHVHPWHMRPPDLARSHPISPDLAPRVASRRAQVAARGGRPSPRVSCTLTTINNQIIQLGRGAHARLSTM